ncbi:hypothetical protein B7494_g4396 [Chlorociboria aeruginascens]|nr:hypothetical protein B7494_g4396 [Chlorociboria aeruginascens]
MPINIAQLLRRNLWDLSIAKYLQAPTNPKKRPSIRSKTTKPRSGSGFVGHPPSSHASSSIISLFSDLPSSLSSSAFTATKKDKRTIKHSTLISRIEKSHKKPLKRRRPNKKLVATLESLADALPEVEEKEEGGEGKIKHKSLKSRPGAMKKREKLERMERERFGKNMAILATGPESERGKLVEGSVGEKDTEGARTAGRLAFPDLVNFASEYHKREIQDWDLENLCIAGEEVKKLCMEYGLSILMLQPLDDFEGWRPSNSTERNNALLKANAWIQIMKAVGTDMLLVASSCANLPPVGFYTSRKECFATDLAELAEMLYEHSFRLAYEPRCWSPDASSWSTCLQIIALARSPNIGLCLDTFHIAAESTEPIIESFGTGNQDASNLQEVFTLTLLSSLVALVRTVPKNRIYVLQISDAYKLPRTTVADQAETNQSTNGTGVAIPKRDWCNDYRTFPGGKGCLPVGDIVQAILNTGYRGYLSLETYDGGPDGGKSDTSGRRGRVDEAGFDDFARKGKRALDALLEQCVNIPQ